MIETDPRRPVPMGVVQPAGGGRSGETPWFLDPREILLTLRLRKRWIALPALAALLLTLAFAALAPSRYTASAELLVDPQGLQIIKDDLNPPSQTNDASLMLVDSQMQVLSSDDVLRQVVDRFALDQDPDFTGKPSLVSALVGALPAMLGHAGPARDPKLDALRNLRDRMSVHRLERTFALLVSVTTDDREKAARIAQGVAEIYLSYDRQVRIDIAQRASAAISARLGELQGEVRDAEDKAQAYRTAQNLVGTRTQLVSEQQLGQMGEQLGAARVRAADQLARLNQIQAVLKSGRPLDALPEVLQSTTISQLRTQLAAAERVLADQATKLGTRHPAMLSAQSAVTSARAQLNAEIGRIATSVRDEYKSAAANAATLSDTLERGKSEAIAVGDSMVHLRELERQIEARRSVYESFLVRARELQAQQQLGTSASRIISPATPPAKRDGPATTALLAAALVVGLGLGVGSGLVAEQSSGRIRTMRRLGQHLDIAVAGALPPAGAGGAAEADGASLATDSRYDLAVMRLRNHLWRSTSAADARIVIVTAVDRVSGKSRLACKLATVAAADLDRVLLVDADPDGTLPADFDLAVTPVVTRSPDGRTVLPERGVAQLPALRYVSVSRRSAKLEFRTVTDHILGRVDDFDAIIVNAGLIGADLFTERFVSDPRVTMVLLTVSATGSDFATLDGALSKVDRGPALVAVLTDAAPPDA